MKCSFPEGNESWASSDGEISDDAYNSCKTNETEIVISVSFAVYIIALLSIISYVLFMIFGGVGIFLFL